MVPLVFVVSWLLLAGCGRISYSSVGSVGSDGSLDGGRLDASDTGPTDGGSRDTAVVTGDGGSCIESPCRLVIPQCGCPGESACYPRGAERECVLPGTGAPGDPCSASTDCRAGHACSRLETGDSSCLRMCERDVDCATGLCLTLGSGAIGGCMPGCDPVSQTGCRLGLACYPLIVPRFEDGADTMAVVCIAPGTKPVGDSCAAAHECEAGMFCVEDVCVRSCDVGTSCPAGEGGCRSSGLFIEGQELGLCY